MISIIKEFSFCAGHRLRNYQGKCANLHGHNYLVHFYISTETPDEQGFVLDFSEVKKLFGSWLDDNWDHSFILSKDDDEAIGAVTSVKNQRLFLLDENPTAENMALYLLNEVGPKLLKASEAQLQRVVLWETKDSFVDVCLSQ